MADNRKLLKAMMDRDQQAIKLMIEEGYDINLRNPSTGMTALDEAVKSNDVEMVKLLLEHGADIIVGYSIGYSPLFYLELDSIVNNSDQTLEIVKLIASQNVPLYTSCYQNILTYGSTEMVKAILQSNIDLFGKDALDHTPIHYLARNKNDGVIEELHGKIFDVNTPDLEGYSPLHLAAFAGLPHTVEFLLNNKANPNALDMVNLTPLSAPFFRREDRLAPITTYRDVIGLLLKYGADPQFVRPFDDEPVFSFIFPVATMTLTDTDLEILFEPIISHLAKFEKHRGRRINKDIVTLINSEAITRKCLKICRQQLTMLETTKINDFLNLYQLLISDDSTIEIYASDPDIVSKIRSICVNEQSHQPYGFEIRKRFEQAMKMANLKKEAAFAFCNLNSMDYNASCLFVDQIMGYLNRIDLQRLCDI